MNQAASCRLLKDKTNELVIWCEETLAAGPTPFEAAQAIAKRLGVHFADGVAEVGFGRPRFVSRRCSMMMSI